MSEIKSLIERFPERLTYIQKEEERLGTTFFKPDYIPKRFSSGIRMNKKGKTVRFPTAGDVESYVKSKNATLDMFNQEPASCMSFYGICE